jgi:glycosyltransferase involved in cell wall biosynthesis
MSHRIIVVARALEADLFPSARSRARVVYNGISGLARSPSREAARSELGRSGIVPTDAFGRGAVFASLSSLTPFKGLHHLVRAVASLQGAATSATFLLAGPSASGAYPEWLKREATNLKISDRVFFLGFVRDPDLVLAAADALVLPSVERERLDLGNAVIDIDGNEGLPRSILEAMRAGLPCIASDIAGTREQITDGLNGILVPSGDPTALAAAVERLIHEPETRERMGARGREICRERFPIEGASSGLVDVLTEARDTASGGATAGEVVATLLDAVRAFGR